VVRAGLYVGRRSLLGAAGCERTQQRESDSGREATHGVALHTKEGGTEGATTIACRSGYLQATSRFIGGNWLSGCDGSTTTSMVSTAGGKPILVTACTRTAGPAQDRSREDQTVRSPHGEVPRIRLAVV